MPVYNGEKYLKEAIDSILEQTFRDFELLIISDGSTDESKKIIENYTDYRIRFLDNQKNMGLIFTLNRGLAEAVGEYIARMDQDDISMPDRFQKQYDFLENNPRIALVGGWAMVINEKGDLLREKRLPINYNEIKFNLLFRNPIIHSAIFFRKSVVKDLGGYNKEYEHAEDFELYSRLIKNNFKIINLPEFLVRFRIHNTSIGQTLETKNIQNDTVKRIIFENANEYLKIDQKQFLNYYNMVNIGSINLINLIKYLKMEKNLYKNFVKNNFLYKDERRKIYTIYNERKNGIMRKQLSGQIKKVPFLYYFIVFLYKQYKKTK